LRLLLSEAAAGAITLPGVQPDWAMLLYKTLRIAVVAITGVVIYPYIPDQARRRSKASGSSRARSSRWVPPAWRAT